MFSCELMHMEIGITDRSCIAAFSGMKIPVIHESNNNDMIIAIVFDRLHA